MHFFKADFLGEKVNARVILPDSVKFPAIEVNTILYSHQQVFLGIHLKMTLQ